MFTCISNFYNIFLNYRKFDISASTPFVASVVAPLLRAFIVVVQRFT